MEDESKEAEVYRERELSEETRRKLVENIEEEWNMNIICRFPSGFVFFVLVFVGLLLLFWLRPEKFLLDGSWFYSIAFVLVLLGSYYIFICRLMRPDQRTVWNPVELSSEYIKLPLTSYQKYSKRRDIVIKWEDIKQINPLSSEHGIYGFELETKDMNLYKRFYPAFIVEEFQAVILETRDEIKKRFPDKYWAARWEKEEKEEEQQSDTNHQNI